MFQVCPAAPRDIETATDYHERGGGRNRTRSSPTGPAEQEEGGSLKTRSQYQLIQIIVVGGGDMFEGQCPSTPRNGEHDKRPTET